MAMRTPLRMRCRRAVRRLPAAPSEEDRRKSRFTISCEARAGSRASGEEPLRGTDVYGLTAASLAHAAILCADPGYEHRGALAPAQAFDPTSFLAALADVGLSTEIEPLPGSADR